MKLQPYNSCHHNDWQMSIVYDQWLNLIWQVLFVCLFTCLFVGDHPLSRIWEHEARMGPVNAAFKNRCDFGRAAVSADLITFFGFGHIVEDVRCEATNVPVSPGYVVTFRGSGLSRIRDWSLSTVSSSSSAMFTAGTLSPGSRFRNRTERRDTTKDFRLGRREK